MKRIHFIIDIRRHRGDSSFIIGLINRFVAGYSVLAEHWLIRPDQADLVSGRSVIAQADANDESWVEEIAIRIRQISQSGEKDMEFMVLSFDGQLLNSAERLMYSDNLRVRTKHLGTLVKNSWTLLQTGRSVAGMPVRPAYQKRDWGAAQPLPGSRTLPLAEAIELAKSVLRRGEYYQRDRALPQKDLRIYMATVDSRAAKVPGDFSSENLIRHVVDQGLREGWMVRFNRIPGASGSEMLYLVENHPALSSEPAVRGSAPGMLAVEMEGSGNLQPAISESASVEVKKEEPAAVVECKKATKENLPERTALMEAQIQDEKIGALVDTRQYFFDAAESILAEKGETTLVVSHLLAQMENVAKKRAADAGYSAEQKWGIARRWIQRLMVRSGVLLTEVDGQQVSVKEGPGDESSPVVALVPNFRMVCMAYMAETIIRRLEKIHFKDDYFHLGMTLFRRGKQNMVDAEALRVEADKVLAYLLSKGRIELVGAEIRIPKIPFGAERVRVMGT